MVRKTLLVATVFGLVAGAWSAPARAMGAPSVSAKAAIVIDGVTGQILYGKNIHERHPQASTTKMMAAIVAMEKGHLSDLVQVSKKSSDTTGSSIYLETGERLTFEQLLYGMMLNSGNDATNAVAEYIAGDADKFVALMNQKARDLGLKDTHYVTPHGLPAAEHYSSAYDLAMIARYALANPAFATIASTKTKELPGNHRIKRRLLVNHNKLLRYFPGAWGGKTGYTTIAGKCFVGSAKRDGRYVIEAILGDPDCWRDAEHLLNYGIDAFASEPLATAGQVVGDVSVRSGAKGSVKAILKDAIAWSVPRGKGHENEKPSVQGVAHMLPRVVAPVHAGQVVGDYELLEGGHVVATVPVVAREEVPAAAVFGDLRAVFVLFLEGGLGFVVLFGLFRVMVMRRRARRKRARGLLGASNAIQR